VRLEWSPAGRASARRFLADQPGMRAIGSLVEGLTADPVPADGFHRGDYHRLRTGPYRVIYVIEDDIVTIERVDRSPADGGRQGL
jgi:mRNA-degrading endonuclease RelE of RelBE toxin-antitoxin system